MDLIGKCSICGGDVRGFKGAYFGTPPPAVCMKCSATNEDRPDKIIRMRRKDADEPRSDVKDVVYKLSDLKAFYGEGE